VIALSAELELGVIATLTDDSPFATLARARPQPAWSPCPEDRGRGLELASKIGLDGQPDIRQAD
jgi:hypothetical protein